MLFPSDKQALCAVMMEGYLHFGPRDEYALKQCGLSDFFSLGKLLAGYVEQLSQRHDANMWPVYKRTGEMVGRYMREYVELPPENLRDLIAYTINLK